MDASDKLPVGGIATTDSLTSLEVLLANTPKAVKGENLIVRTKPLPPDSPEVAKGVAELEALFPTNPAEVAYYEKKAIDEFTARMQASREENGAPRNFLQAHMVIIDQLLMDPAITTTKLSAVTGYSRNWLHKVMASDAFQAKLAERQKALCDPIIMSSIKDRLQGLVSRSLEVLEERMESDKVSLDTALNVFGVSSKAMGLGAVKATAPVNQFVVHIPQPIANADTWAAAYTVNDAATAVEAGGSEVGATVTDSPEPSEGNNDD